MPAVCGSQDCQAAKQQTKHWHCGQCLNWELSPFQLQPALCTCMSNRLLVCSPSRVNSAAVASARSHCKQGLQKKKQGVMTS